MSGLVTTAHAPVKEPQALLEKETESRWMTPVAGFTPLPESVPFEVVIVSEPVVS